LSKRVWGDIAVQWRLDDAGGHGVEANIFFCVLDRETLRYVFKPPFVIIEAEALMPTMG
jgi:hypothetical protein